MWQKERKDQEKKIIDHRSVILSIEKIEPKKSYMTPWKGEEKKFLLSVLGSLYVELIFWETDFFLSSLSVRFDLHHSGF